jgi:hypothetical protein
MHLVQRVSLFIRGGSGERPSTFRIATRLNGHAAFFVARRFTQILVALPQNATLATRTALFCMTNCFMQSNA